MPSGSADVVYFDPMFRRPTKSSTAFDVLRTLAHKDSLSHEALAQARRVARRAVVVMDQWHPSNGDGDAAESGTEGVSAAAVPAADADVDSGNYGGAGELERLGMPVVLVGQRKRFGKLPGISGQSEAIVCD
eukprot:4809377-Prymnesium_polylepis.1